MTTLPGYRPPALEAIHPRSNVRHWYLTWGQVTLADGVLERLSDPFICRGVPKYLRGDRRSGVYSEQGS